MMGRIPARIWYDGLFRPLTERQKLLVLGLMTVAKSDGVVRGDPGPLMVYLGIYETDQRDAFADDLEAVYRSGLVAPVGQRARFIHIDAEYVPKPKRGPVPKLLRRLVLARDGMVCGICGGSIPEGDLHIDHIFPVARGGTDDPTNLQPAHSRCNISKGARV